jgi:hypothetical protein
VKWKVGCVESAEIEDNAGEERDGIVGVKERTQRGENVPFFKAEIDM